MTNKEGMNMQCVVYVRTGNARQVTGEDGTVQNRIRRIKTWTQENGFIITKKYIDEGKSGLDDGRPALSMMMDDAAQGKFDNLIALNLCSLSRNSNLNHLIEKLNNMGVRMIAIEDGFDSALRRSLHIPMMHSSLNCIQDDANRQNKVRRRLVPRQCPYCPV
jgi:DNA invertase Pin-like site-specific DNA recombinase